MTDQHRQLQVATRLQQHQLVLAGPEGVWASLPASKEHDTT